MAQSQGNIGDYLSHAYGSMMQGNMPVSDIVNFMREYTYVPPLLSQLPSWARGNRLKYYVHPEVNAVPLPEGGFQVERDTDFGLRFPSNPEIDEIRGYMKEFGYK